MKRLGVRNFQPGIASRPDYVDCRVLAASVAEQHTIPAGAEFVSFSAEMPFYALFGSNPTATIPSVSDITDGSSPLLNPIWVPIEGAAKISLIARTAGNVVMSFYGA